MSASREKGPTPGLSPDDSQLLKGVAILMMLWIHLFFKGRFEDYGLSTWPLSMNMVHKLASYCKLCVSVFAFVSGYGLHRSFVKVQSSARAERRNSVSTWVFKRYVSTFSRFWLIVLITWIACLLFGPYVQTAYFEDVPLVEGVTSMFLELTGIGQLMGLPSLITAWWYMGAALAYILLTPLICHSIERSGWVATLGLLFLFPRVAGGFPGYNAWLSFLPAYTLGMVFSSQDWFVAIRTYVEEQRIRYEFAITFALMATIMTAWLVLKLPTKLFWDVSWGLFAIPLIVLLYLVFMPQSVIRSALTHLGRRSADVYLVHNVYRSILCPSFVYGTPHILTTFALLLFLSLATSLCLDLVCGLIHYDRLKGLLIALAEPQFEQKSPQQDTAVRSCSR